jgi:5-methylthioadenosine/S-adenosylhomocysteine deaminase
MTRHTQDTFLAQYTRGVTSELGPPPGHQAGPAAPGPALAPPEPVALGGLIVLEDHAMRGWVTISGTAIEDITTRKPAHARPLVTDGVVLPGMLDMHNHPDFNVFAPWEPPQVFPNRYAWRGSRLYDELIKVPNRHMDDALTVSGARLRYAEIRAMVGGVTAIQGMNGSGDTSEPLVRNVDRFIFGSHRARTIIDLPAKVDGFGWETFAAVLKAIDEDRVDAFYVHLAEGQRDDDVSRAEFDKLKGFGGLLPQTIVIHGTALTPAQLGELADVGGKLVWSPQSNLRLYRETTDIKAALDAGVPVCLGADWMPSGSMSLLEEMRVAANEMHNQGVEVTSRMLVGMVTSGAADIAGLGDNLGRLEVGRPADVVVLSRLATDAYDSVMLAEPQAVDLVMIGGDVTYTRREWLDQLAPAATSPTLRPVIAWGKQMVLDNGYRQRADDDPVPTMDDLRADLIHAFPQVGPIWA